MSVPALPHITKLVPIADGAPPEIVITPLQIIPLTRLYDEAGGCFRVVACVSAHQSAPSRVNQGFC